MNPPEWLRGWLWAAGIAVAGALVIWGVLMWWQPWAHPPDLCKEFAFAPGTPWTARTRTGAGE